VSVTRLLVRSNRPAPSRRSILAIVWLTRDGVDAEPGCGATEMQFLGAGEEHADLALLKADVQGRSS